MPRRNLLAIVLIVVAAVLCYQRVERNPYGRYLSQVLATIQQRALEPVPQRELFDGAMEGIVGRLDEYTDYISSAETAEFEAELEQQFGGVGVMIKLEGDPDDPEAPKQLVVVNPPLFGTPARGAGILAGDRILAIDGQAVAGMTMREIIRLMRGEVGEPVVLTVLHQGEKEPEDLTLQRAIIRVPSVLGDRPLGDGHWDFTLPYSPRLGYIRVTSFGEKTAEEIAAVLEELQEQRVAGLILDLRDNPGGLLTSAVETCDLFLPAGLPIVSIKGRGGELERAYYSSEGRVWPDLPIAILVNKYTASASEIVAACLQDHDRAVVVGARTWGKGTVQHVLPIEGGKSLLKLTAASYWRPSGANIHRVSGATEDDAWGVMPNEGMNVPLTDEQFAQLHRYRAERDVYAPPETAAAPPEPPSETPLENDPQLRRAVEVLQETLATSGGGGAPRSGSPRSLAQSVLPAQAGRTARGRKSLSFPPARE